MPEIINYKRVLSHSILISTYTQIISELIVQNILYLQHIANKLPNAFTNQKCHQIIFLHINEPERSEISLNSRTKIRGGEVWSQARNTTYYKHPQKLGETSSKIVNANQHYKCC